IAVPVGTVSRDARTGDMVADLVKEGQSAVIARGGSGGRGNARFATPTLQAPRYCEPGEPGEVKEFVLELKLLADVGLVGFPNAGKSTLIPRVSSARPKIADYPFTTLTPNLGMVRWKDRDFVMADIPGIIEGAHTGVGLGLRFLRHIERTRIILYLIDLSPDTERDPRDEFTVLRRELQAYSPELVERKQLVVLNKCDLPEARQRAGEVVAFVKDRGYPCFTASAASGEGLAEIQDEIIRILYG
nr:Obg family GTPase CgtA [Deltaproteobacteria bacterium]